MPTTKYTLRDKISASQFDQRVQWTNFTTKHKQNVYHTVPNVIWINFMTSLPNYASRSALYALQIKHTHWNFINAFQKKIVKMMSSMMSRWDSVSRNRRCAHSSKGMMLKLSNACSWTSWRQRIWRTWCTRKETSKTTSRCINRG